MGFRTVLFKLLDKFFLQFFEKFLRVVCIVEKVCYGFGACVLFVTRLAVIFGSLSVVAPLLGNQTVLSHLLFDLFITFSLLFFQLLFFLSV